MASRMGFWAWGELYTLEEVQSSDGYRVYTSAYHLRGVTRRVSPNPIRIRTTAACVGPRNSKFQTRTA